MLRSNGAEPLRSAPDFRLICPERDLIAGKVEQNEVLVRVDMGQHCRSSWRAGTGFGVLVHRREPHR
jgi:hypothetical protein